MYLELIKEKPRDIAKNYGKPYYVYLSLSNMCNAKCSFCDVGVNREKVNAIDVTSVINELSNLGTKYIHFTGGGEPFVNDDIFEYLEYCTLKGMKIILISNGLNLNEEKIKQLSKYNIEAFFFSIDSSKPKIHNELRGIEHLWETATNNINLLKIYMKDIKIVLNNVINTKNIDEFEEFITMKNEVNFDYINPIIIKSCAALFPTDEQIKRYNNSVNHYYELADEMNVKFLCKNINILEEEVANDGDRSENEDNKCVYPSFCAFIDCPTGNVYPCDCSIHVDKEQYKIGNLIDSTFTEVWNGSKRHSLKEQLLEGKLNCKRRCDEANCFFNDCYFKEGAK